MGIKQERELIFRQVGDFKVEVVDRRGDVKFTMTLDEKGSVHMSSNNVVSFTSKDPQNDQA